MPEDVAALTQPALSGSSIPDMAMLRRRIPWLAEAVTLWQAERPGHLEGRARMVKMIDRIDRNLPLLSLTWCGFFAGHCLEAALGEIEKPPLHFRARHWEGWGEPAEPQLGAILIFWHFAPRLPFGHIAFYWAEDDESYHVLGGNQHNSIRIVRYPKDRLVQSRWPEGWPQPGIARWARPQDAPLFA